MESIEREGPEEHALLQDRVAAAVVRRQMVIASAKRGAPKHVTLDGLEQPARRTYEARGRVGRDDLVGGEASVHAAAVDRVGGVAEEVDRRHLVGVRAPRGGPQCWAGRGVNCKRAEHRLEFDVGERRRLRRRNEGPVVVEIRVGLRFERVTDLASVQPRVKLAQAVGMMRCRLVHAAVVVCLGEKGQPFKRLTRIALPGPIGRARIGRDALVVRALAEEKRRLRGRRWAIRVTHFALACRSEAAKFALSPVVDRVAV